MTVAWNAITPTTIVATALVAVLFAAFLWHTHPRVNANVLLSVWLGTLVFIFVCGAARLVDGSPTWQTYIGVAFLWSWYCAIVVASVVTWRRVRGRVRHG